MWRGKKTAPVYNARNGFSRWCKYELTETDEGTVKLDAAEEHAETAQPENFHRRELLQAPKQGQKKYQKWTELWL